MTEPRLQTGRYRFERGRFIPDAGMKAINERLSSMRLLADAGDGTPSFYVDPSDGSYWECREYEDYRKELRKVNREYIEQNYPTVDPDRRL